MIAGRRLFPEGWEKTINHDVRVESNQENSHKKWGGRTYPKARNALTRQSATGRGEDRRKESGTAEGCESRRRDITQEPRVKDAVHCS
ncbi:hypothetical protein TNCV_4851881 [Trichonephila clavipes]|nr:hypothetical protein TNCV_4851881 [Trichonephila clavipes]